MSDLSRASIEQAEQLRLQPLEAESLSMIGNAQDLGVLETYRVELLGKSGAVTRLLKDVGLLPAVERAGRAAERNRLKSKITGALEARRAELEELALTESLQMEGIDISAPPRPSPLGLIHPISRTIAEVTAIFGAMGFILREGPDIEDEWHGFGALNIPAHHPARAMMDTFYLAGSNDSRKLILRPHTSSVQIRTMLEWARNLASSSDPDSIRIMVPGRTYRSDHDATHSPMFHQTEGLVIGQDVTLGHLKGCLTDFLRAYFNIPNLPLRFRSSYFPFTEPSMEVDVAWSRKSGEIGDGSDWLEILGSGMVHPNVMANCGIDPRQYQGFAFGVGIERIAMLKYGIPDLRLFYENDIRWLSHHGQSPFASADLHNGCEP